MSNLPDFGIFVLVMGVVPYVACRCRDERRQPDGWYWLTTTGTELPIDLPNSWTTIPTENWIEMRKP